MVALNSIRKSGSNDIHFNSIRFEDKVKVDGMLEIEDELKGEGSYAIFISHLKLIFGKMWLAIRFFINVDTMKDKLMRSLLDVTFTLKRHAP